MRSSRVKWRMEEESSVHSRLLSLELHFKPGDFEGKYENCERLPVVEIPQALFCQMGSRTKVFLKYQRIASDVSPRKDSHTEASQIRQRKLYQEQDGETSNFRKNGPRLQALPRKNVGNPVMESTWKGKTCVGVHKRSVRTQDWDTS